MNYKRGLYLLSFQDARKTSRSYGIIELEVDVKNKKGLFDYTVTNKPFLKNYGIVGNLESLFPTYLGSLPPLDCKYRTIDLNDDVSVNLYLDNGFSIKEFINGNVILVKNLNGL